jgi:creatinine amidohydrolase
VPLGELKSSEFATLDPNSTLAVLPVAATEQHGPHLPVMTDTAIMEGMIATVLARLPDDLRALFLPVQTIGKSNEHLRSPGTITISAERHPQLVRIGEACIAPACKLVIVIRTAATDVIGIVARGCACGSACWSRRRSGAGSTCRRTYSPFDRPWHHAGGIGTS